MLWLIHAEAAQEEGLHNGAGSSAGHSVDQRGGNAAEHCFFAIPLVKTPASGRPPTFRQGLFNSSVWTVPASRSGVGRWCVERRRSRSR